MSTSSTRFLFFGPFDRPGWPPWPLMTLAEAFLTFPLNRWTEFNKTWQEAWSQCLPSLCFSGRSEKKNKMAVVASDWLRHFDFSSETTEWNSMKLDRKQDLNVLYQVCVFRADKKNKMAAMTSDWLRHFDLSATVKWNLTNLDKYSTSSG